MGKIEEEEQEVKVKCKCSQSQDLDGFCDSSHAAQKAEA
jgi:hypothetical protein